MKLRLGSKTINMPSARLPQIGLPYLRLLTALRIPIPKMLRFGGGRAALMSILVVAGGFGAAFALVINGTNDVPTWPEAGAVYSLPNINGERLAPDESDPATRSQTLQINLGNGVRLDKLELSRLDLGKAGLTNSLYVTGVTGAQVDVGLITNGGVATIGEILIDDVDASVGAWDWSHINAGCIVMENTNQFGNGTGINSASAVFNDTVKARVITDNLVDTPISVK